MQPRPQEDLKPDGDQVGLQVHDDPEEEGEGEREEHGEPGEAEDCIAAAAGGDEAGVSQLQTRLGPRVDQISKPLPTPPSIILCSCSCIE